MSRLNAISTIVIVAFAASYLYLKFNNFNNEGSTLQKTAIYFFDKNSLVVHHPKEVDPAKLMICWKNGVGDSALIYQYGRHFPEMEGESRKNVFQVFYDRKLVKEFTHIKKTWWQTHRYMFHLIPQGANLDVSFKARKTGKKEG